MSEKSVPPSTDSPILAVIDQDTMVEIERLAELYGVDPEEVIAELVRLDLTRPEGVTLH